MNVMTLFLGVLLAGDPSAAIPNISGEGRLAIDTFLASEAGRMPGIVALVVSREHVLYAGAFGKQNVADDVAMREDSIFRIASMTKPITSVAVMRLVEDGKICLDEPVSRYLPSIAQPRVLVGLDRSTGEYSTRPTNEITIRHLLCHTSGFGYWFCSDTLNLLEKKTGKDPRDLPLLHAPGTRWTYGMGTYVLGELVENVSGQKLDKYLQVAILDPLAMGDTGFAVPKGKLQRLVTTHQRKAGELKEEPNPDVDQGEIRGDYGLRSTAKDYGRFLQMLLGNGQFGMTRVLSSESVKMMTTNQIGDLVVELQPTAEPEMAQPFPIGAGRDKFGLGFQITMAYDENNPRSVGSLSWGGVWNTHFWADPERGIGAVVLMQVLPYYDDQCIEVLRGFEQRVYANLE